MTQRIHDDEPDIGEAVVRSLLESECPAWAPAPIEYLATSGTDNAMWRIRLDGEPDLVVRLPRRPHAAAGVEQETAVLRALVGSEIESIARTPTVRHVGQPHEVFPYRWSVLEWIDGVDAWSARDDLDGRSLEPLAIDLARAATSIAAISGLAVAPRQEGGRGGPLGPVLDGLDEWLEAPNASSLIDVAGVRRLAAEARELVDEPVVSGVVHGDLIPGNLLVADGRLAAVIDWGGVGYGDVAQDYAPAWAVLTAAERPVFREAVGADDAAWIRGRAFELQHAVAGVVYYVPRRHPLGDVMARTLDRILTDR